MLMTAFSAGFALLPLMIGSDAPGKEILHPVAITIFGGLVSATLLDTLLTPVLFLHFGRKPLERLIARGLERGDAGLQRLVFLARLLGHGADGVELLAGHEVAVGEPAVDHALHQPHGARRRGAVDPGQRPCSATW